MRISNRFGLVLAVSGLLSTVATAAEAQGLPIQGVTGTMALEGTVEQEYAGANTVMVKTADGVRHVFNVAKGMLVHGGGAVGDALPGLRAGATVVVHYTVSNAVESVQEIDKIGDEGLTVTEGVVTRIDRRRKRITVRFDNGTSQTFVLTDRAAADAGKDVDMAHGVTNVVVYYSDESGRKVAHFFRKAS